jgi:hypothetical protein
MHPASGGRNAEVDFKGEERKDDTLASTTDPAAKMCRRGNGYVAQMAVFRHTLMENRNGICVGATVTEADGRGERVAAPELVEAVRECGRSPPGADQDHDTRDFVDELREGNVRHHVIHSSVLLRAARPDSMKCHYGALNF